MSKPITTTKTMGEILEKSIKDFFNGKRIYKKFFIELPSKKMIEVFMIDYGTVKHVSEICVDSEIKHVCDASYFIELSCELPIDVDKTDSYKVSDVQKTVTIYDIEEFKLQGDQIHLEGKINYKL